MKTTYFGLLGLLMALGAYAAPNLHKRDSLCGPSNGDAKCPNDMCCSSSGFCGSTFPYCSIGCDPKYGKCWSGNNEGGGASNVGAQYVPASAGGLQCGINFQGQQCPGIMCCSQEGFCGVSSAFCGAGCQIQYGSCSSGGLGSGEMTGNVTNSTTDGGGGSASSEFIFCDSSSGKCPSGMCCNALGICGTKDGDCDLQRGCNVGFGTCLPLDYQCGPSFGNQKCGVTGWCCSSVGYCGIGPDYCEASRGCQSECSATNSTTTTTALTSSSSTSSTSTSSTSTSSTSTSSSSTSSSSTSTSPTSSTSSSSAKTSTTSGGGSSSTATKVTFTSTIVTTTMKTTTGSSTSSTRRSSTTTRSPTVTFTETETVTVTSTMNGTEPTPNLDGRCGPTADNAPCPEGSCCSIWGFCGFSENHCDPQNCLYQCGSSGSEAGSAVQSSTTSTSATTGGANSEVTALPGGPCGPLANNATCPEGSCCSIWGFCGSSDAHCDSQNCLYQCSGGSGSSAGDAASNSTVTITTTVFETVTLTTETTTSTATTTETTPNSATQTATTTTALTITPNPSATAAPGGECGILAKNATCPEGQCCSIFGFCGVSESHCSINCAYQCRQV